MLIRNNKEVILKNNNIDKLIKVAKDLPECPGVYFMKDKHENIIYIGKSKSLKDRVTSYFYNLKDRSKKIEKMISQISSINTITMDTELEALIDECKYIKLYKPPYNTLLKNHTKYTYLKIRNDIDYPYLEVSYEKTDENSIYFGPYFSRNTLDIIIEYIKKNYKIRYCTKYYSSNNSPCLNYHLKKCVGACALKANKINYEKCILEIIDLLKGNISPHIERLKSNMMNASMNLDFEKANECKKFIEALDYIQINQEMINETFKQKDILAYEYIDSDKIKLFLIKGNSLIYKRILTIDDICDENYIDKITYHIKEVFAKRKIISTEIDKSQLDEVNIIYNYLNKNNIHYIELKSRIDKDSSIEARLKQFLKSSKEIFNKD